MRQRVVIAMAMALGPELLLLDEPTTALDVIVQREILQQLKELQREMGFAVLFITHDLSLLVEFSNRIAIMYSGRHRRGGGRGGAVRPPRPPVHGRADGVVPAAHGRAGVHDRDPGEPARPARPADRLPVPSAMPGMPGGAVPRRDPGASQVRLARARRRMPLPPGAVMSAVAALRARARGALAVPDVLDRDELLGRARRRSVRSTTSASRCDAGVSRRSSARAGAARAPWRACSAGSTSRRRDRSCSRTRT